MSTSWEPGQEVYVTGAMGGQKQRAVFVGIDPNDSARALIVYIRPLGTNQSRSVHLGRLRSVLPLPDAAASALAEGMTGLA
jgi:hypothetical protein